MSEVDLTKPIAISPTQIALYGPFGVGKSLTARQAATYFWEKHKWRTQVVSKDPGSREQFVQAIEEGYVDYLPIAGWNQFASASFLQHLAEGGWVEDVNTPGSAKTYGYEDVRLCPACGGDTGARGVLFATKCAACGKALLSRPPLTRRILPPLQNVGLRIYEGFTYFSGDLLEACRQSRPGDKFFVGSDSESQAVALKANDALKNREGRSQVEIAAINAANKLVEEGLLSVANASAMDHYVKAGADIIAVIRAASRAPIPYVLWTGHEGVWDEPVDKTKRDGAKVIKGYGPMFAYGSQMGPKGPLGDFAVVGRITVDPEGKRTLQLDKHSDAQSGPTLKWMAKRNIPGLPASIPLPHFEKANGFAEVMKYVEKARTTRLP